MSAIAQSEVCYVVFTVCVATALVGYFFPVPNHTMEIPPIEALRDPSLYARDFYVQEMTRFTPRFYYQRLIVGLTSLGLSMSAAYFLLFLGSMAASVLATRRMAQYLNDNVWTIPLLQLWTLNITAGSLGGIIPIFGYQTAAPAFFAMPFVAWAVVQALGRHWFSAYSLLGLASLPQVLVGLLAAVAMGPILLFDCLKSRKFGTLVSSISIAGAGVAAVIVPIYLSGSSGSRIISDREFVYLYGYVTHYFHIVPSSWNPGRWINAILFYAGGLLLIYRSRAVPLPLERAIQAVVGVLAIAMCVNFVGVEIFPLATIAKLQFGRISAFAQLAIVLGLSVVWGKMFANRHWLGCLLLALAPVSPYAGVMLLGLAFGLERLPDVLHRFHPWRDLWLAVPLVVLGLSLQPERSIGATLDQIVEKPVLALALCAPLLWKEHRLLLATAATAMLVIMISDVLPTPLRSVVWRKVNYSRYLDGDIGRLARRFAEHSPKDALVLVPPTLESFRMMSQRAVVVDMKNFPYTDAGILEWKQRMEGVFGLPIERVGRFGEYDRLTEQWRARSLESLKTVASKYDAEFIVTNSEWHSVDSSQILVRDGSWIVVGPL